MIHDVVSELVDMSKSLKLMYKRNKDSVGKFKTPNAKNPLDCTTWNYGPSQMAALLEPSVGKEGYPTRSTTGCTKWIATG